MIAAFMRFSPHDVGLPQPRFFLTDTRHMHQYRISHLKQLEAESIHIFREVASEFDNPVMLYSVGKDSSVMVRLAQKAFYPGKVPFPLLHVDTSYKYKEMYEFRDRFCEENNLDLIVRRNEDAIKAIRCAQKSKKKRSFQNFLLF